MLQNIRKLSFYFFFWILYVIKSNFLYSILKHIDLTVNLISKVIFTCAAVKSYSSNFGCRWLHQSTRVLYLVLLHVFWTNCSAFSNFWGHHVVTQTTDKCVSQVQLYSNTEFFNLMFPIKIFMEIIW